MEIILDLLQDNAIISNVISIVVLGVLGIITKFIVNSIGAINTEKTQLLQARATFERVDQIAEMIELNAKLYKDAVIGSNLPAATKSAVLEDYNLIQNKYRTFFDHSVKAKQPAQEVKKEEAKPIIQEVVQAVGQDVLSKLREQLVK
jgi:hypothetical protein